MPTPPGSQTEITRSSAGQPATHYIGVRHFIYGTSVWKNTPRGRQPLDPCLNLARFGRTHYDWGHPLPGAMQLALALLTDHSGDPEWALRHHQVLFERLVMTLPYWHWIIARHQIDHVFSVGDEAD